jgi:colanic acid/amylovoran biosynthesis glycosyltransferase
MDVVLFTSFFPYEKSEPFLVNEFEFTRRHAGTIAVLSLYGSRQTVTVGNAQLFRPVLHSPRSKRLLFLKGKLNLASLHYHISEFFRKKIFLHPRKAYWLGVSCLISRMTRSSAAYKELIRLIEGMKQPLLYFYWGDNLTSIIPYLKDDLKGKKISIVIRFHGSDLYEELKSNYAPLRDRILRAATFLCPVSEYGAGYLKRKYPSEASKVKVSRLGVFDNGMNPYDGSTKTVISISNLVPLKRVSMIIEALDQCAESITWHHFGDGPELENLKLEATQVRPGLKIIFHGHVPNAEIITFLKDNPVSLFINASSTEGVPVSIMEALSFGIPVLATDVGGVGELVNERNGKLVPSAISTKNLSAEISRILTLSENDMRAIRENARATFFEKADATKNYGLFYEMIRQAD